MDPSKTTASAPPAPSFLPGSFSLPSFLPSSIGSSAAAPQKDEKEEKGEEEEENFVDDDELDKHMQDAEDEEDRENKKQKSAEGEQNDREVENERTKQILRHFTREQENRYEKYKRSRFPTAGIKKVVQSLTGYNMNQTMCIVMAGITKMYVGELVEHAKLAMEEWGETGPIQPKHLREAYRRLKKQNRPPRKMFKL